MHLFCVKARQVYPLAKLYHLHKVQLATDDK